MLTLQDRHGLSVNMLLWCLWCATKFEQPGELVIRKAMDLSQQWNRSVSAPLREIRRTLKSQTGGAPAGEVEELRRRIKEDELFAERLEQVSLESLAVETLSPIETDREVAARARKALAAYVRMTAAPRTADFSVSLLEDLIGLSFPAPDCTT